MFRAESEGGNVEIWRLHHDRAFPPMSEAKQRIMFRSDGDISEAVDMLLDMGVDCVTPLDPSGIAYRDFNRRYGNRVSVMGDIDLTWPLTTGTPDDIGKDAREHMEALKPGGRWVAGSSHRMVNYVPHENF